MSVNCVYKPRPRRKSMALRRQPRALGGGRRLNLESLERRNLLTAGFDLPAIDLLGDASEELLRSVAVEQSVVWTARAAEMDDGWAEVAGEIDALPGEETFQVTIFSLAAEPEESQGLEEPVWFTAWRADAVDEAAYADAEMSEMFVTAWDGADEVLFQRGLSDDESLVITQVWDDADEADGGEGWMRITMVDQPLEDAGDKLGLADDSLEDGEFRITMVAEPLEDAGDQADLDDHSVEDGEVRITMVGEEAVTVTAVEVSPLHNPASPYDVNGDGVVGPLDVLIVVNYINSGGSWAPQLMAAAEAVDSSTYFVDVDGDGEVGPLDVIRLLNLLNGDASEELLADMPASAARLWYDGSAADPAQEDTIWGDEAESDLLADAGRLTAPRRMPDLAEDDLSWDDGSWKAYEQEAIFSDDADWLLPELL